MILDPATMHPLRLENETIDARQVFHDNGIREEMLHYVKALRRYEDTGFLPESVDAINRMKIHEGYIPEGLSHQDLTGRQIISQAVSIGKSPFFKAVTSHPEYRDVRGFYRQKRVIKDTVGIFNLLRQIGNLGRKSKIHTIMGSSMEVKIAWHCFGAIWPAGINLYSILRELYPAFHGRITGYIPDYISENMECLLDEKIRGKAIWGLGRITVDDSGRFLGLYPVAEVPANQVTLDSPFVSQDQIGRKAIVRRIIDDIIALFRVDPDRSIVVLDYAGGVGNLSELLLKNVYSLRDTEAGARLMKQVRVVVIDMAEDQLAAGYSRVEAMNGKPGLAGIHDRILFLKGDVTRPFYGSQLKEIREKFGLRDDPIFLGMTAYTIGALDYHSDKEGTVCAEAMAREIYRQCSKVYAVDFSSPMWRPDDFMRDTGMWGREYMRTVHGVSGNEDERKPLPRMLAAWLSFRYGLRCGTIAEFVRMMAIGSALAAHYLTVWPGSDGHSAGYSITEDGMLRKPGILSFARNLQSHGARVAYKSKVWLVGSLDLGKVSKGTRAWAVIPGWIADFVVAEKDKFP
jgi:hypothetical protein